MIPALVASVAVLGGNCGPPQPTSLVPQDYRTRFSRVIPCRNTLEHLTPNARPSRISNIAIYVNPESAAAYMARAATLPANTLIVKEEFADPGCSELLSWSVARKEPGFAPDAGDWHWQHVNADRTLAADGRVQACSNASCHGSEECRMHDWMCARP